MIGQSMYTIYCAACDLMMQGKQRFCEVFWHVLIMMVPVPMLLSKRYNTRISYVDSFLYRLHLPTTRVHTIGQYMFIMCYTAEILRSFFLCSSLILII
ncbi:hypothetical protein EDB19DRAFT_1795759 [Suillus lakei]|nr:hypothetical protein EDB19DRAFT_1795759 [Suillus lakei]